MCVSVYAYVEWLAEKQTNLGVKIRHDARDVLFKRGIQLQDSRCDYSKLRGKLIVAEIIGEYIGPLPVGCKGMLCKGVV